MNPLRRIALTVNGASHDVQVEPRRLLAHWLREDLGLTGAHIGCETGQCGACVALLDGRPVKTCNLLAVQAHGAAVVTIEGMARDGRLTPVQEAFCEAHAVQCGFCTPGMIMTASTLLKRHCKPARDEIRAALYGNLCRCTGYENIVRAVERASELADAPGVSP